MKKYQWTMNKRQWAPNVTTWNSKIIFFDFSSKYFFSLFRASIGEIIIIIEPTVWLFRANNVAIFRNPPVNQKREVRMTIYGSVETVFIFIRTGQWQFIRKKYYSKWFGHFRIAYAVFELHMLFSYWKSPNPQIQEMGISVISPYGQYFTHRFSKLVSGARTEVTSIFYAIVFSIFRTI